MTGHLIHIGYPKTGSTFLQRWFEAHPQIAYREGGIAGFSDVWDAVRTAASRSAPPLWRVTSSESLTTPLADTGFPPDIKDPPSSDPVLDVDADQRACDLLRQLFPTATVLVMTRGFRAMIASSYSQYVRAGGTRTLNQMIGNGAAVQPWHYDRLIAAYCAAFGRDRVMVLPYEALRNDAPAFCRDLETRLGLDPHPFLPARVNETLSPVELAWYPRISRLSRNGPHALNRRIRGLVFRNRLGPAIRLLQAVRPLAPVDASLISDTVLTSFRGRSERLRDLPEYAPYSTEYLL